MVVIYGFVGLSFIVLAFLLNILGIDALDPLAFINSTLLFTGGYWLLFDSIDYSLNGTSILHKVTRRHRKLFYLILTGIVIGLTFDFFGAYIAGLWEYPYLSVGGFVEALGYLKSITFGYGVPMLMYYSIYRVVLTLLSKEFGALGVKLTGHKKEAVIFKVLGVAGIVLFLVPLFISTFYAFGNPILRGLLFSFTLIGMWFILEFIEYSRHERSLLKDIFHGFWNPMLALVIGAITTGFVWEFLNLLKPSWIYKNYPLSEYALFGVPVVILLGWIPLFIVYLSFYRAVFRGREDVW